MVIYDFLDYMRFERRRSEQTLTSYKHDLEQYVAYLDTLDGHVTVDTADTEDIRGWMEMMMERGNSATSICRRLSAVRSMYRFALSRGLVSHDPAHLVRGPKRSRYLPQFVREDDMDRLLDSAEWGSDYISTRARTILILLYETGMRASELTGLDDSSVDFDRREIRVVGKGNKQRAIPFGDELRAQAARRTVAATDGQGTNTKRPWTTHDLRTAAQAGSDATLGNRQPCQTLTACTKAQLRNGNAQQRRRP